MEIRLSEMTGPLKVGASWYLSEPESTELLLRGGDPQGGIDGHREERTRRLVGGGVLSLRDIGDAHVQELGRRQRLRLGSLLLVERFLKREKP